MSHPKKVNSPFLDFYLYPTLKGNQPMMKQNIKAESAILNKMEQITAGANLLWSYKNNCDDVEKYVAKRISEISFSEEQQAKIDRCGFIINQAYGGKYSKGELINMVQKMYKVSKRQALYDFKSAKQIYLSVACINKQFEIEMQLLSAKQLQQECVNKQDMETALLVQNNITSLLKMIPIESEQPGEEFESNSIEVSFNPELLGGPKIDMNEVLAVVNAKRNKKITIDMFENLPSMASCSP